MTKDEIDQAGVQEPDNNRSELPSAADIYRQMAGFAEAVNMPSEAQRLRDMAEMSAKGEEIPQVLPSDPSRYVINAAITIVSALTDRNENKNHVIIGNPAQVYIPGRIPLFRYDNPDSPSTEARIWAVLGICGVKPDSDSYKAGGLDTGIPGLQIGIYYGSASSDSYMFARVAPAAMRQPGQAPTPRR